MPIKGGRERGAALPRGWSVCGEVVTLSDVSENPVGYTESSMDQEMNFPNPVARTDLPSRKRRWPKVLIACGAMFVLGVVFFPQLVSSKLGRKFVVSYIASRTNSVVALESVKTSWFGGTEFRFLMIKDPLGRRISVSHLACGASLPKLLRGKYDLGDAVVNGLFMDYVIDDGRGG